MLVDLGRNDVGRVAKPGTVKVTDLMRIERYSHVMHIVSDVEAIIDEKYDMFDLFAATFTAGTMTGAPKIRAMELIAQIEGIKEISTQEVLRTLVLMEIWIQQLQLELQCLQKIL